MATVLLWLFLFPKGCTESQKYATTTVITDTVYIDKPYKEIVIKEIIKPKKIYIYQIDTIYRKQIEKDTLITSVQLMPKLARVHSISPKGIPSIAEYPLDDVKTVEIDHKGNAEIKKRKYPKLRRAFKRAGQVLIFAGGVWVGKLLNN